MILAKHTDDNQDNTREVVFNDVHSNFTSKYSIYKWYILEKFP